MTSNNTPMQNPHGEEDWEKAKMILNVLCQLVLEWSK